MIKRANILYISTMFNNIRENVQKSIVNDMGFIYNNHIDFKLDMIQYDFNY